MGLYLIMMGVQGAGKGTQAQIISEAYGIPHVSTGDLFRAMKTRTDDLAQKVQQIMASGQLVDDDTTNEIVADRLAQPDAQNGVILDGYPRNQIQAAFLEKHLAEKGEQVTGVLSLDLDFFVAFKRAFGRVQAEKGDFYNIYTMNDAIDVQMQEHPEKAYPPRIVATLKETGEVLKRRPDDASAVAVVKRIDTYVENTQPLIEYYEGKGLLYRINAEQNIEAVTSEIRATIDQVKV